MAERLVRMGITFLVIVYIARYLGPGDFGLLNYAISIVGVVIIFSQLGLEDVVTRELVNDPDHKNVLLGTGLLLKFSASLIVVLLLLAILSATSDAFEVLLIMVVACGMLFRALDVVEYYFRAIVQAKYIAYANFAQLFLSSALKIFLVYFEFELIWFAIAVLSESVIRAAFLVWLYLKHSGKLGSWRVAKEKAYSLLGASWPLLLSGIVVVIYMKIDQIMLKQMIDNEAVGYYAAAVQLSEAWYFVPVLVTISLFPAILASKKVSETLYIERLQKLYDLMAFIAFIVAVVMSFASVWLVTLFYGEAFRYSGSILFIHVWAGMAVFMGVVRGKWLLTENLQRHEISLHASGAVINVLLNIVLIPAYQGRGAAYATIISYFFATIITPIFIPKLRKSVAMILRAYINIFNMGAVRYLYKEIRCTR